MTEQAAEIVPLRDVADVQSPGQWARDLAATYRRIAEGETWQPRRDANFAEAHKYEGIANAMDRSARPGGEA